MAVWALSHLNLYLILGSGGSLAGLPRPSRWVPLYLEAAGPSLPRRSCVPCTSRSCDAVCSAASPLPPPTAALQARSGAGLEKAWGAASTPHPRAESLHADLRPWRSVPSGTEEDHVSAGFVAFTRK